LVIIPLLLGKKDWSNLFYHKLFQLAKGGMLTGFPKKDYFSGQVAGLVRPFLFLNIGGHKVLVFGFPKKMGEDFMGNWRRFGRIFLPLLLEWNSLAKNWKKARAMVLGITH